MPLPSINRSRRFYTRKTFSSEFSTAWIKIEYPRLIRVKSWRSDGQQKEQNPRPNLFSHVFISTADPRRDPQPNIIMDESPFRRVVPLAAARGAGTGLNCALPPRWTSFDRTAVEIEGKGVSAFWRPRQQIEGDIDLTKTYTVAFLKFLLLARKGFYDCEESNS